nr:hypothetical protein GCM10020092_027090 [Actinoplanes digitatis]
MLGVRGGSAPMVLDVVDAAPADDGYRFRATALVDRVAAGVTAGRGIIARRVRVTVECRVEPSAA